MSVVGSRAAVVLIDRAGLARTSVSLSIRLSHTVNWKMKKRR